LAVYIPSPGGCTVEADCFARLSTPRAEEPLRFWPVYSYPIIYRKNVIVGGSWTILADPGYVKPLFPEGKNGPTRKVLVGEELHAVFSG
jgi:hypothetical protein